MIVESTSRFRPVLFSAFLLVLIFPVCALVLSMERVSYNAGAWVFCFFMFIFLPLVDQLAGRDPTNHPIESFKHRRSHVYYAILILLSVPAVIGLSAFGAHFFSVTPELNWIGRIGWIVSLGLCVTALALCAGHELLHRPTRFERFIGKGLLAFVCNGWFIAEHVRGHHVNVATPADIATARVDQSFYSFLRHALPASFQNAWSIERKRLEHMGIATVSWRNEMIGWHLFSTGFAIAFYSVFGFWGLLFYLSQGLIALIAHQIINYIQHYGLRRRKQDDGRYERFNPAHAWNSNFLFSGMLSFQLQRHTDHHLNPRRRYPYLQHVAESPQMPMGYFGMFILALIPPLWFKVMNLRLLAYQKCRSCALTVDIEN